jgi:hypothetical protein
MFTLYFSCEHRGRLCAAPCAEPPTCLKVDIPSLQLTHPRPRETQENFLAH